MASKAYDPKIQGTFTATQKHTDFWIYCSAELGTAGGYVLDIGSDNARKGAKLREYYHRIAKQYYLYDPDLICTALYPKGLYIVTGIVQGLLCLLILFMLKSVVEYVKEWQSSETAKYLPTRKVKEDNEF